MCCFYFEFVCLLFCVSYLVTIIILFSNFTIFSSMSTSVSGCLPFCVKLVFCYYCLLSLWGNKYDDDDDDDDDDDSYSLSKGRLAACFFRVIRRKVGSLT